MSKKKVARPEGTCNAGTWAPVAREAADILLAVAEYLELGDDVPWPARADREALIRQVWGVMVRASTDAETRAAVLETFDFETTTDGVIDRLCWLRPDLAGAIREHRRLVEDVVAAQQDRDKRGARAGKTKDAALARLCSAIGVGRVSSGALRVAINRRRWKPRYEK
ncbi:MAG: hypothetical protein JW940_02725 [Polyangiaceae bacterium]|nr:hypothetical protein [Polyangiaceae bacterium]